MDGTCRSRESFAPATRIVGGKIGVSIAASLVAFCVSYASCRAEEPKLASPTAAAAETSVWQVASASPDPIPDAILTVHRAALGMMAPAKSAPSSVEGRIQALGHDPIGIEAALAAYRADHLDAGDAIVAKMSDPVVRTTLEWVALRDVPQAVSLARLRRFAGAHPDWPAADWLRHQMEGQLLKVQDPTSVTAFFSARAPETMSGKLALAKALRATGNPDGLKLARSVFRENELPPQLEGWLLNEFGADLSRGDYKYRADRLMYQGRTSVALRYAAKAGSDVVALERARAAVMALSPSDAAIGAVPSSLQHDPGLILAEAQKLRRANKLIEAARLMQSAPRDAAALIDGDAWWTERRVLARELLDDGKMNAAYIVCALHGKASNESDIDAEFHAGWIALRFMHEPDRATYHFWMAAKLAQTPTSIARIAYWQGRTAEAASDPGARAMAKAYYEKASLNGSTYYGQLAREIVKATSDLIKQPNGEAVGDERAEAVRAIELLYAAGDREAATSLAMETASSMTEGRQVAALASVISAQQDAHLALMVGKLLGQRGIQVDPLAFPTFGIPTYKALARSAPASIVYSVARQESAFVAKAASTAGAKGLMQMIASTAKHTALKAGVSFNVTRLIHDAAFNAQLGAAHLGALLAEHDGSLILSFAAYNAGGGRVQQWIKAYGDPRKPGVDAVDWVERIPFTETRNYVQRVIANVGMYTAIFGDKGKGDLIARATREARL